MHVAVDTSLQVLGSICCCLEVAISNESTKHLRRHLQCFEIKMFFEEMYKDSHYDIYDCSFRLSTQCCVIVSPCYMYPIYHPQFLLFSCWRWIACRDHIRREMENVTHHKVHAWNEGVTRCYSCMPFQVSPQPCCGICHYCLTRIMFCVWLANWSACILHLIHGQSLNELN